MKLKQEPIRNTSWYVPYMELSHDANGGRGVIRLL